MMGEACRTSKKRNSHKFLIAKYRGERHLENVNASKRIILKWMLVKHSTMIWSGLVWLRAGGSRGLL
jgi:hypothetical protein